MKVIKPFETGEEVPKGAVFLSTITFKNSDPLSPTYVQHFFLVEKKKKSTPKPKAKQ